MHNALPYRTLNYFTVEHTVRKWAITASHSIPFRVEHTVRKWAIAASHHPAFSAMVFSALLINTAIVASFRLSAPPASIYPEGRGLPAWAGGFLDFTTFVLAFEAGGVLDFATFVLAIEVNFMGAGVKIHL
ncbi:hypothetical protein T484DRAFT_1785347 [Baffinella frigidus]|nr:hypothetical protein T484DRAFT_1785347 [Cryptophyta sp. CCMP2293]